MASAVNAAAQSAGSTATPRRVVRVTHIAWNLEGGGLESLIATLAERFEGTDVEVSAITLAGRPGRVGEAIRPRLAQFHVLDPLRVLSLAAPFALVRAIRATRAEVVHLHSGAWLKGAWAARLAGVRRVIYTEHGREHDDGLLHRLLDGIAARLTHVVVAVSQRLHGYLHRALRIPVVKIVVVPNAVDTRRFSPGQRDPRVRSALGITDDALVVGSIGRLVPVKAYDILIRAMARLAADAGPSTSYLVIFGEGPERDALDALARELGVAHLVRLAGWSDRPAMAYRAFDVFALPSWSEGASLSLLEAMASGIVPVVSRVGASAELLGDELSGQVVPAGDVEQLAAVLRRTLASAERRTELARAARLRVEEEYELASLVEAYRRLYHA